MSILSPRCIGQNSINDFSPESVGLRPLYKKIYYFTCSILLTWFICDAIKIPFGRRHWRKKFQTEERNFVDDNDHDENCIVITVIIIATKLNEPKRIK